MAGEHAQGQTRKTLKVSIPTAYHLNLHRLKVLTGRTISDTVEQALTEYLEEIDLPSTA